MITRYSRPEMRAIWTDENKLRIWLQIELLASEALAAEGTVPSTVSASPASNSICSQMRSLFSSVQMARISGRE